MTAKPQVTRAEYPHFVEVPTRWMDNDVYGHVNNALYYAFFDTAINRYLIDEGGLDIAAGRVVGLAAESHCRFLQSISFPEAVEVELTLYLDNGEQESRLLFVGPTAHAIHEAQRRCMVEDISALLARQFGKEQVAEVTAVVDVLFEQEWKNRAAENKQPERAFETATRPSRKHLH